MVQYIPSPSGSYAYPDAGKQDLKYNLMGNLGQGMGQSLGDMLTIFAKVQQAKQQKQQMAQFMQSLSPQGSGPPSPGSSSKGQAQGGQQPQSQGPQMQSQAQPQQPPKPMDMKQVLDMAKIFGPQVAMPFLQATAKQMYPPPPKPMRPPQPMVDTPFGPMSPYQWAGISKRQETIDVAKGRLSDEQKRIEQSISTNVDKEVDLASQPLDAAQKGYQEIIDARGQLPANTQDKDIADAWNHLIPQSGVVKDPLFGSIKPEVKNYVQKIYQLQKNLSKYAANPKDPHSFTYQTMLGLLPTQKLPSKTDLDKNFGQFQNSAMAIKRTAQLNAQAKYKMMGMNEFARSRQEILNDPSLIQPPEPAEAPTEPEQDPALNQEAPTP